MWICSYDFDIRWLKYEENYIEEWCLTYMMEVHTYALLKLTGTGRISYRNNIIICRFMMIHWSAVGIYLMDIVNIYYR